MRGLLVALIASILILTACTPAPPPVEEISCTEGYIESGEGCCPDANNNFICDTLETEEPAEEPEEDELEEVRLRVGSKWRITEEDLPRRIFMQRNSRILYTVEGKEEVVIVDKLDKYRVTMFHENKKYKVDVGRTKPVGPLIIKYEGTDPPKGGNYATLYLEPFYKP